MIPIRLYLKGFLSYLDPVEVDFSSFDLACISGSNGAGKSSLLDAITWALFGQARRRDDALINSFAEAAEVIFEFSYEDNFYRIQRSKPRGKATLLEFTVLTPEKTWKVMTEKSIRETEARIQSVLRMDYETFINASFFLQGKADQFAQQKASERKRILSNILGLEVWETYKEEAANRRKVCELELKGIDTQLEDIQEELSQEESRRARLREMEEQLRQASALRQSKENELNYLRQLIAALADRKRVVDMLGGQAAELRARCTRMEDQLASLREEEALYRSRLAAAVEIEEAYCRWRDLRATLAQWEEIAVNFHQVEARRLAPLQRIASEESRLRQVRQGLLEMQRQVESESARQAQIEAQIKQYEEEVAQAQACLDQRAKLEEELRFLVQQAAEWSAENNRLTAEMQTLKDRIDRLQAAEGADCPLCGQPLSLQERSRLIIELETEGKAMGDRYRSNKKQMQEGEARRQQLEAERNRLTRAEEDLRQATRQLDRWETERARVVQGIEQWQASGQRQLESVEQEINRGEFALEARKELSEIDRELKTLGYDAAAHDAARRAEQQARAAEEPMRQLEAARASLAPLERQIQQLAAELQQETERLAQKNKEYHQAESEYRASSQGLPDANALEREVNSLMSSENNLRTQIGMQQQSIHILGTLRERQVKLNERRSELTRLIARLKVLERAFSKDGVPALLIEQALPEIENQANELLDRLSGGTMSVSFQTQRDFKDKNRDDKKETLDILIRDSSGTSREYEMYSGGEAFRVNFAIRLALSQVLAQRAGARLQTLVVDEGFGSQDAEGRQRLIEAINLVKPDFARILVITHLEDLKDAFPNRIEVEKTISGSRVRMMV